MGIYHKRLADSLGLPEKDVEEFFFERRKAKAEEKLFGKQIKDMSLEEALTAMSVTAVWLQEKTGDPRFKDVEDVARLMAEVKMNTGSDDAAIESAIAMLKKRGYKDPEEEEDGTHDI